MRLTRGRLDGSCAPAGIWPGLQESLAAEGGLGGPRGPLSLNNLVMQLRKVGKEHVVLLCYLVSVWFVYLSLVMQLRKVAHWADVPRQHGRGRLGGAYPCGLCRTFLHWVGRTQVCNHPDLVTGRASGVSAYPPASLLTQQCGKLQVCMGVSDTQRVDQGVHATCVCAGVFGHACVIDTGRVVCRVQVLERLLPRLHAEGRKVLIFSQV
jgi:hypothetical protein